MSFTTLTQSQVQFLEQHLRGNSRSITAPQAAATYGIKNLRARMSEMRSAGLRVRTATNKSGGTMYSISARDLAGSRAARFV
jgi:hypothetical protein